MKQRQEFDDADIVDIHKDLSLAIYMLHHIDEQVFSKREIQDVCFASKTTLNKLEKSQESIYKK